MSDMPDWDAATENLYEDYLATFDGEEEDELEESGSGTAVPESLLESE